MNNSGTTIFLTTHYIEEAERLCQRIGFIVDGEIVKIGKTSDLMQEAQKENTVEFVLENNGIPLKHSLIETFPDIRVKTMGENIVRILSKDKIDLMPFMKYLDEKNVLVREARIIRPSLEEVFVKVTGIEANNMKKERNGGKKI